MLCNEHRGSDLSMATTPEINAATTQLKKLLECGADARAISIARTRVNTAVAALNNGDDELTAQKVQPLPTH